MAAAVEPEREIWIDPDLCEWHHVRQNKESPNHGVMMEADNFAAIA